jgi:hypothetical protein
MEPRSFLGPEIVIFNPSICRAVFPRHNIAVIFSMFLEGLNSFISLLTPETSPFQLKVRDLLMLIN